MPTIQRNTTVVVKQFGGPNVIDIIEESIGEPDPDQVRITVLATGVSFADLLIREGVYPGVPKPPFVLGYDLVGRIDEVGSQVRGFKIGDHVAALTKTGSHQNFINLRASDLTLVPSRLDPAQVVCLVMNYITAYQMLHRVAHVRTGERVLVHNAAGGVGSALLDLGELVGLEMYGVSSEGKESMVTRFGARSITKREDFVKKIKQLTGGGVDVVFEGTGGGQLSRSFDALRPGGRLVGYGASAALSSGGKNRLDMAKLGWNMMKAFSRNLIPSGKRTSFYGILNMKEKHPEWYDEDLSILCSMLEEKKISPIIADQLPMSEVVRAHKLLSSRSTVGKIVLIPTA